MGAVSNWLIHLIHVLNLQENSINYVISTFWPKLSWLAKKITKLHMIIWSDHQKKDVSIIAVLIVAYYIWIKKKKKKKEYQIFQTNAVRH